MITKLLSKKTLPKMSELLENYNDEFLNLFKVVGRYLIETKTNEELYNYIHNIEQVLKDGETILEESLLYFNKKYFVDR